MGCSSSKRIAEENEPHRPRPNPHNARFTRRHTSPPSPPSVHSRSSSPCPPTKGQRIAVLEAERAAIKAQLADVKTLQGWLARKAAAKEEMDDARKAYNKAGISSVLSRKYQEKKRRYVEIVGERTSLEVRAAKIKMEVRAVRKGMELRKW